MAKRNVLGRGLDVLIPDNAKESQSNVSPLVMEIPLDKIEANPFQPRTKFDEESLKELAASIKEFGIIQPVTLRKLDNDHYQIIAGERRFRASKISAMETIPAYIREADDESMLEMALIENIQREDLDAIEVALSYQRLLVECQLTHEALSTKVGKDRSTISNYLRLLKLPAPIQKGIIDKTISMGHARALVNIPDYNNQLAIFDKIISEDLSVRKTEELAKIYSEPPTTTEDTQEKESLTAKEKYPSEYGNLKTHLSEFFGTNVDFALNKRGKGKIVIPFGSVKDLERIIGILDSLDG